MPLRVRVVEETLRQTNAMHLSVFQLLQAQRDKLASALNQIDAAAEYWQARAALEQVVAGRMVDVGLPESAAPSAERLSAAGGGAHGE